MSCLMLHGASSLVRVYEPRGSSIGAAAFELTILERLRHPNVIKVVDAWALAGRGFRFRAKPCWGPVWSRLLRWHIRDIIPSPGFEPPRAQAFIIRPGEPWGLVAGVLTGCRQERERERERERKKDRERKKNREIERETERERETDRRQAWHWAEACFRARRRLFVHIHSRRWSHRIQSSPQVDEAVGGRMSVD